MVDFCRRFAVISKHDTPVPISQIHSFHSHVAVGLWRGVCSGRPEAVQSAVIPAVL